MDDPNAVLVPVRCDCGHKFHVPVGGLDLETLDLVCPNCGRVDRFTPDQIAGIVEQHGKLREKAVEMVRKVLRGESGPD